MDTVYVVTTVKSEGGTITTKPLYFFENEDEANEWVEDNYNTDEWNGYNLYVTEVNRYRPTPPQTGFRAPVGMKKELCEFLGVPEGTKMARTEITKQITNYIRENNLNKEYDGRQFVPDSKLSAVLGPARFCVDHKIQQVLGDAKKILTGIDALMEENKEKISTTPTDNGFLVIELSNQFIELSNKRMAILKKIEEYEKTFGFSYFNLQKYLYSLIIKE